MDWQDQLISLYLYVCKCYQSDLWVYCQRMSNYADLRFSDEEVLTLFLFGIMVSRDILFGPPLRQADWST